MARQEESGQHRGEKQVPLHRKEELVSFKVDAELADMLRRMPNKSQFIRKAVLQALDHECPLCQGTGILSPESMEHWKEFSKHHHVVDCDSCGATYIACELEETAS
jgi:uncharacterized hydantoinase/oxoprolinase family protein